MAMKVKTVGDIVILQPEGELTTYNGALELDHKIADLIELGLTKILLDLDGIYYADTGGIETLLSAYDAAIRSGGRLKFSRPRGPLRYLLSMTKLSMESEFYPDQRKALASFG
jgi:anti-anti-sigma factor